MKMIIQGIKCDNCDWQDLSVNVRNYDRYLNRPCPKCGCNLLTQEDYDFVRGLQVIEKPLDKLDRFITKFFGKKERHFSIAMNGKDKPVIEEITRSEFEQRKERAEKARWW